VTKFHSGWDLIGIRWEIVPESDRLGVRFETRPSPYIPTFPNGFWMGFFVSLIFWLILAFLSLIQLRLHLLLMSVIGFVVSAAHLWAFMKGHVESQKETAEIARSGLLDGSVQFAIISDERQACEDGRDVPKDKSEDSDVV
jgi:hypothetical protein